MKLSQKTLKRKQLLLKEKPDLKNTIINSDKEWVDFLFDNYWLKWKKYGKM